MGSAGDGVRVGGRVWGGGGGKRGEGGHGEGVEGAPPPHKCPRHFASCSSREHDAKGLGHFCDGGPSSLEVAGMRGGGWCGS